MQITIEHRPSYSLGVLKLEPREQVRVEGGAMVSMSQGIQLETGATGGILQSLKRSFLGGESFFQNIYTAPEMGGEITVAPALPGDLQTLSIHAGEEMLLQSGSYVASEIDINTDTHWGGAKTFFGGEGLFMLKLTGMGEVVISSYGAIFERVLSPGETYTVDTGHLVAFPAQMPFRVRAVGGIKSTLFSGEGLVVDLTGPGRVLMQTRSMSAFLSWLVPQLPKRSD